MRKLKDDKKIKWTENYTDKSEYLKRMYNDIVGEKSYWRFEGKEVDGPGEWYVVVSPAGVYGEHERKWFAGVRKLPDKWPAGGKKFDSLIDAFTYAADTWGIPKPKSIPRYSGQDLIGIGKRIDDWKAEHDDESDGKMTKQDSFRIMLKKEAMATKKEMKGGISWILPDFAEIEGTLLSQAPMMEKIDTAYATILRKGVQAAEGLNLSMEGHEAWGERNVDSVYGFNGLSTGREEAMQNQNKIGVILSKCDDIASRRKKIDIPPEMSTSSASDFLEGKRRSLMRQMHDDCKFLYGFASLTRDMAPLPIEEAMPGRDVLVTMDPRHFGIEPSQVSTRVPVSFRVAFRVSDSRRASSVYEVNNVNVTAELDDDSVYRAKLRVPQNAVVGYHDLTMSYGLAGRSDAVTERMKIRVNEPSRDIMSAIEYADHESEMFASNDDYRTLSVALIALKERMVKMSSRGPRGQRISPEVESVENRSSLEHVIHASFRRHYEEKTRLILKNFRIGGVDEEGNPRYPILSELMAQGIPEHRAVAQLINDIPDNEFPVADYVEYSRIESGARCIRIAAYGGKREFSVGVELHDDVIKSDRFATLVDNMEAANGATIDRRELVGALNNGIRGDGKDALRGKRYSKKGIKSFKKTVEEILRGIGLNDDAVAMGVDGLPRICRGHAMTKVPGSNEILRVMTSSMKKLFLDILGTFYTGKLGVGDSSEEHMVSNLFQSTAWAEDMFLMLSDDMAPTSTIVDYLERNAIFPEFAEYVNAVNERAAGGGRPSFPDSLTPKQFAEYAKVATAWKRNIGILAKNDPTYMEGDSILDEMEDPQWIEQNDMVSPSSVRNMYPGDIFNIFSNSAPVRVSRQALENVNFPGDEMKKISDYFDGSDRISTVKLYEILGSYGTGKNDRSRRVNLSQYIPAAMEIDRRDSSLSILENIGVSCFPNVGYDNSGVPVSYMDMDMESEFKFLRKVIGEAWGFKENHPDVYLRVLKESMVPKEMRMTEYRPSMTEFDRIYNQAVEIVREMKSTPESQFVADPEGTAPENRRGSTLQEKKSILINKISDCEERIMSFIDQFRSDRGGTLPSDSKRFKSAQVNAFNYYLLKAAKSLVPQPGGNNVFPVDPDLVREVVSNKEYKIIIANIIAGEPQQIPNGSKTKVVNSDSEDIIIDGREVYDSQGNLRDIYIVLPNSQDGYGYLVRPSMFGGNSVVVNTPPSGMATGLDRDLRAKFKPYSHDVAKGSLSHSRTEDAMSVHGGEREDEPPLSTSAHFPPVSMGNVVGQMATGRYGVFSLSSRIEGTNVSDRYLDYLSESAKSVTNIDIGRHMYEDAAARIPEDKRSQIESLIDSSIHMSSAMHQIYRTIMSRVENREYPVMWWRGRGGNDMKDGFDMAMALDIVSAKDYYSGDVLHTKSSLDAASINAFLTAKDKVLQEAALILSSPDGQNTAQKQAIISVISRNGGGNIENYIRNFHQIMQEMASDEQEMDDYMQASEEDEGAIENLLSETNGETGIPEVDEQEHAEMAPGISDEDETDDLEDDIVADDEEGVVIDDEDALDDFFDEEEDDLEDFFDEDAEGQQAEVPEGPAATEEVTAPSGQGQVTSPVDGGAGTGTPSGGTPSVSQPDDDDDDDDWLDDFFDEEEETSRRDSASSNGCTMMREALKAMAKASLRLAKEGKTDKSGEINKIIKRYICGNGLKNDR